MTRSEWDVKIETASDPEILDMIMGVLDGEIMSEALYADNEICNGGFFQYYSNSIFDARKHISDLRKLDQSDLADLVQRSLNCFPNAEQPRRLETDLAPISDRVLSLVGSKDCFTEIEGEYYRICKGLEAAIIRYFRAHSGEYWSKLGEVV